jgi:hypothetical protein
MSRKCRLQVHPCASEPSRHARAAQISVTADALAEAEPDPVRRVCVPLPLIQLLQHLRFECKRCSDTT